MNAETADFFLIILWIMLAGIFLSFYFITRYILKKENALDETWERNKKNDI